MDDALREYARLVEWFGTPDGVRGAYLAYHSSYGGIWPDSYADPAARWALATATATDTAQGLAECHPIWCDPPMVDLVAAAADSHPPEPFQPDHLLAPDGIVLFAKPLPAIWRDAETGDEDLNWLAAVSWATGRSTTGEPVFSVVAWRRHTGVVHHADPDLAVYYPGLRAESYAVGRFGAVPPDHGGPAGPHRILQTFTALCRTRVIREDTHTGSKAARQRAARAGLTDPAIRRVYLRRPEHGQAELDAARAARRGEPTRGHWVRGHWKRQWFGSINEHRMIWIEGYPRGDFTRGTVTGTKTLIAAGGDPRPDPEPRADAPTTDD